MIADVHVSPLTVLALQQHDYDILRVTEVLNATATDAEILEFARTENRIVITQDLDFSALVALNGYAQPSLVNLSTSLQQQRQKLAQLSQFLIIIWSKYLIAQSSH